MTDIPEKFATWMGLDRKVIDWHPTVDEESCAGCGLCVINCGRNVLAYDAAEEVTVVENPFQCKVGCSTCGTYCPTGAIDFPPEERVQELIQEHGLVARAREEIAQRTETGDRPA